MFQTIIIDTCLKQSLSDLSQDVQRDINLAIKCEKDVIKQTIDPTIKDIKVLYKLLLISTDDDNLESWKSDYTLKVLMIFPLKFLSIDETDFLKDIIFKKIKNTFHLQSFSLSKEFQEQFKQKFPSLDYNNELNNVIYCEVGNNFIDECSESPTLVSYEGTLSLNLRIDKHD